MLALKQSAESDLLALRTAGSAGGSSDSSDALGYEPDLHAPYSPFFVVGCLSQIWHFYTRLI